MRFLAGAALVWLLAGVESASDAESLQSPNDTPSLAVLGPGWAECAEVNSDVSGDNDLRSLFTSWLQGYLTGRNDAGPLKDTGADISPYALFAGALEYCENNPGMRFSDAARSVHDQLVEVSKKAK
jgi:hypothetical protein